MVPVAAGIASDADGNIYVTNGDSYQLFKITPAGAISRRDRESGGEILPRYGLVFGPEEELYSYVWHTYPIYKFDDIASYFGSAGVTAPDTLAGGTKGYVDGDGANAKFNLDDGSNGRGAICVDKDGNLYVADGGNNAVRKITPDGTVTTLAGGGPSKSGFKDGTGSAARFKGPLGIAVDSAGNVYVGDNGNEAIRKVTPEGKVTTLVSRESAGTEVPTTYLVFDSDGNLYGITDTVVYKILLSSDGAALSSIAGWPSETGTDDGYGWEARFRKMKCMTVTPDGIIYVVDQQKKGETDFIRVAKLSRDEE